MLTFTGGFFYYYSIVRQDLLIKLPIVSYFDLPKPWCVKLIFSQLSDLTSGRDAGVVGLRYWLFLEWLGGCLPCRSWSSASEADKLVGLVEEKTAVSMWVETSNIRVATDFFRFVFFFWFQGYQTATEIYNVKRGYVPRELWFDCPTDERGALEYMGYKPFKQGIDTLGRSVTIFIKIPLFMSSFPNDVREGQGFKLVIRFSGLGGNFNKAALSALRLQQRITITTDALLNTKR